MAATVCPTITVNDEQEFGDQIELVSHFSQRVHIDLADGKFTPDKLIPLELVWWPESCLADLHIMYMQPSDYLSELITLDPKLVIIHSEANVDVNEFANAVHEHGIKLGVALQTQTPVEKIKPYVDSIDHVLVFSGKLGYYGGQADLTLLDKVKAIKQLKPTVEVGWDGGINAGNVAQLVAGKVDVLNVGSFIAHADDPRAAYATLKALAGS